MGQFWVKIIPVSGSVLGERQHWEALSLPPKPEPPAERVKLSDEQFAALVADSEADEMLAVLVQPLPKGYAELLPSQRHARARRAIEQAQRYGESDAGGRMSLCRLMLEFPLWEQDAACVELARGNTASDGIDKWEDIADLLRERGRG